VAARQVEKLKISYFDHEEEVGGRCSHSGRQKKNDLTGRFVREWLGHDM